MPTIFIYGIILLVIVWVFVSNVLYASIKDKQRTLHHAPSVRERLNSMYLEAKWLCRVIGRVNSYDALCRSEEMVHKFSEGFNDCEGFEVCYKGLLQLLEKARRAIKVIDKPEPVDVRYSPE